MSTPSTVSASRQHAPGGPWLTFAVRILGNLFSSLPRNAHTPLPPEHIDVTGSATDFKLLDTFMSNDFARGSRNVIECTGFVDFRDIVAVRSKTLKPKKTVMGSIAGTTDVEDAPEVAQAHKGSKIFEMRLDRSGEKVRFEVSGRSFVSRCGFESDRLAVTHHSRRTTQRLQKNG